MDAYEFREFISPYLPITFEGKTRKYFVNYILEALISNWDNKKYQYSLLSANILFMTIIFRDFWFDDKYLNKNLISYFNKEMPLSYYKYANDFFNLSKYNEKQFVESYLKSLDYDLNEITDIKKLIDYRDHTAHAAGKIYYDADKVGRFFEDYKKILIDIEEKRKTNTINKIDQLYKKSTKPIKEFTNDLLFNYSLSLLECQNLFDYYSKKTSYEDDDSFIRTREVIFKHFLNVIITTKCGDVPDTDIFKNEVEKLIKNNINMINKLYETIESELSCETMNFNYVIESFDNLRCLFDIKNDSLIEDVKQGNDLEMRDLLSSINSLQNENGFMQDLNEFIRKYEVNK